MRFRVYGFKVGSLGFKVYGFRFRVQRLGFNYGVDFRGAASLLPGSACNPNFLHFSIGKGLGFKV